MLLAALLAAAAPAAAETRTVEAVGAVPAPAAARGAARDAAQRAALAEAVVQVGLSLVPDADPVSTRPRVEAALSGDPRDYTSRYRTVEDRGVGPRTVLQDPAVTREYAVRVEAQVDVARVRAKLAAAGLAPRGPAPPPAGSGTEIRRFPMVVEGLTSYRTYAALRTALVRRAGARSAQPREFTPGRATLEVESTQTPEALGQALPAALAPEIVVETLPSEGEVVRIRVSEAKAPAAAPAATSAPPSGAPPAPAPATPPVSAPGARRPVPGARAGGAQAD